MTTPLVDAGILGRTGRFSELLDLLRSANYSDEFICRRYQLDRSESFELDRKKRAPIPIPASTADVLVTLFLAGEALELKTALSLFGSEKIILLEEMGLLRCEPGAGNCYATVALYPVEELYIASDRWSSPDDTQFSSPEDIVYPAFIPNTRIFLHHLPRRSGGRFLDLCGGTGVAALLAARNGAEQAWSGDISERCTRFAEFNRQLNGISSFQAISSDLYQSFENCRFDLISAHPPYVPTLQPKWIFFSGGRDGEEITRRIVEGLPDHLNDNGVFMALTMGTDRIDRPFESRIREWLGESEKEFDVAFIARKDIDPQEFALRANRGSIRTREETELWSQLFKNLGITSLAYGFICIRRRAAAQKAFTIRRQAPLSGLRSPWEWLMNWESAVCAGGLEQLILDSPLHASQKTEFVVLHHLDKSLWNPSAYKLRIDYPFNMECDAQPWMAHMISLCDGKATGREVMRTLIENESLPKTLSAAEFARASASLVSGGFIEVEGFRLPQAVKL
jgi:SAM-dependent methyltransferase